MDTPLSEAALVGEHLADGLAVAELIVDGGNGVAQVRHGLGVIGAEGLVVQAGDVLVCPSWPGPATTVLSPAAPAVPPAWNWDGSAARLAVDADAGGVRAGEKVLAGVAVEIVAGGINRIDLRDELRGQGVEAALQAGQGAVARGDLAADAAAGQGQGRARILVPGPAGCPLPSL